MGGKLSGFFTIVAHDNDVGVVKFCSGALMQ